MANLPFLHAKRMASVIMAKRKPSGDLEPKGEEGEADPALLSAAEDLISAVHMKDAEKAAHALEAAFEILDSQSDEEGNES